MSELLKSTTVRIVGVSFDNSDGTSRQEIISKLSIGEALLIEYFEYNGEPAYAVKTAVGEHIGNLPKDLAFDIYQKYHDCFFAAQIENITGGHDGLKYGCVIYLDIYDSEPSYDTPANPQIASAIQEPVIKQQPSSKASRIFGVLYIVSGIIAIPLGLLLAIIRPLVGFAFAIVGIVFIIIGRKMIKNAKSNL